MCSKYSIVNNITVYLFALK